ncbi:uncharacterized protein MEPE_01186 [Melanopsichium pennsylvanicum]|uniref:Protein ARV n=2 Tax=Melanopsichium pennsylvanicum TaxID=63383 RepID=A0AAJ4XI11_9BASI|nr:conserved hypothetical protein [Melanopsichium pennsylvanicum 4]SNX82480.1 uncharacterized protein MEPE_01186 [Melanopsichium pennsylvanicum]
MPICINCTQPIESLYMRYGKDHIVLSPCNSTICSSTSVGSSSSSAAVAGAVRYADEYLEHDLPIVIIDLILAKPQAYRHLLFNRSSIFATPSLDLATQQTFPSGQNDRRKHSGSGGTGAKVGWRWTGELWSLGKKFLALALVDAYIRWFYLCVQPPLLTLDTLATGTDGGRISAKVSGLLQRHLPMQAGVFFPSMFTPRTTLSQNVSTQWEAEGERAIRAVCSATPLWSMDRSMGGGEDGQILPTLVSYVNVLVITLVEGLALQVCVGALCWLAVRRFTKQNLHQYQHQAEIKEESSKTDSNKYLPTAIHTRTNTTLDSDNLRKRKPPNNVTTTISPSTAPATHKTPKNSTSDWSIKDPFLGCKALLLSQLSPLILLIFVLLWSTKFPHSQNGSFGNFLNSHNNSSRTKSESAANLDRGWTVWIIRTFLASLNAGVAIRTVLPTNIVKQTIQNRECNTNRHQNNKWCPPLILSFGWAVQAAISYGLYAYLS